MIILTLFVSLVYGWNYLVHGDDWPAGNCITGKTRQSPVDLIPGDLRLKEADNYLFVQYQEALGTYKKDAVCLKLTSPSFGPLYITNTQGVGLNNYAYEISFRSEAEHTINGHRSLLEVQVLHKYRYNAVEQERQANKTVISVLFDAEEGAPENPFLKKVIDNYDAVQQATFNILDLIPKTVTVEPYFIYHGSQTAPQCTENNLWIVLETIRKVPQSQIDFFFNLYHNNAEFIGQGNYRNIQTETAKNVKIIYREKAIDEL